MHPSLVALEDARDPGVPLRDDFVGAAAAAARSLDAAERPAVGSRAPAFGAARLPGGRRRLGLDRDEGLNGLDEVLSGVFAARGRSDELLLNGDQLLQRR